MIAPEFFRGKVGNLPSDLPAGSRVEEKSAGPAREHVFNRARHLMTHRPDDFRPAIRQIRMQQFVQAGMLFDQRL